MTIGTAMRQARLTAGKTQQAMCAELYISDTLLSDIEHGRRRAQPDILKKASSSFDNPILYLATIEEVTGGAFSTPWLNGNNVDLHPGEVAEKLIEEIKEAASILEHREKGIRPLMTTEAREKEIQRLLQVVDVRTAADIYIAIRCQQFEISPQELFALHRDKLVKAGFIKEKVRPIGPDRRKSLK